MCWRVSSTASRNGDVSASTLHGRQLLARARRASEVEQRLREVVARADVVADPGAAPPRSHAPHSQCYRRDTPRCPARSRPPVPPASACTAASNASARIFRARAALEIRGGFEVQLRIGARRSFSGTQHHHRPAVTVVPRDHEGSGAPLIPSLLAGPQDEFIRRRVVADHHGVVPSRPDRQAVVVKHEHRPARIRARRGRNPGSATADTRAGQTFVAPPASPPAGCRARAGR